MVRISDTLVMNFPLEGKGKMTPSSIFCLYCASPFFCEENYNGSNVIIIIIIIGIIIKFCP